MRLNASTILVAIALWAMAAVVPCSAQHCKVIFDGQETSVKLSGEETTHRTDRIVNADQNDVLTNHERRICGLEKNSAGNEAGQGDDKMVTVPQLLVGLVVLAGLGLAIWGIVTANMRNNAPAAAAAPPTANPTAIAAGNASIVNLSQIAGLYGRVRVTSVGPDGFATTAGGDGLLMPNGQLANPLLLMQNGGTAPTNGGAGGGAGGAGAQAAAAAQPGAAPAAAPAAPAPAAGAQGQVPGAASAMIQNALGRLVPPPADMAAAEQAVFANFAIGGINPASPRQNAVTTLVNRMRTAGQI